MRSSTQLLDECRRTARRTFGIEHLRPEQESAMIAVLEGRDALVALPTGFGKSLIYQVPAMLLDRPTIVVSPLIALMADQERLSTPRPMSVEACSCGDTSAKRTHRPVGLVIGAERTLPRPCRGGFLGEIGGALMLGQRDPYAPDHDPKRAGTLVDRLELIFEWYKGMVDKRTGRLLYLYDPVTDVATGDGEPIRDIASVWDVEVLSAFLGRDDLRDLIRRSLSHFDQRVIARDGYAIVTPGGESSSIAHSAFLALALARSDLPDKVQRLTPLADGILRQQRQNGSYKVFFDAAPDSGEELYPAEAMLALLEAYRLTGDTRFLESVERGFAYYKSDYYDRGLVDLDSMVFFANWQSQAGRPLFEATSQREVEDFVRAFLFELHDRVIESGFYDRVARRPERQACVEVACGLEGLADAYAVAVSTQDRRTADYRQCIQTALGFLIRAQRTTGCTDRERGGFGGSLTSREQRIDVTGHVASGFIKSVQNGITEPGSGPRDR